MAQQIMVQLVDDLNGAASESVSTVSFGLDGVEYEIDLDTDNALQIRSVFEPYVLAGRRTGGRLKRGIRPGSPTTSSGDAAEIRGWAVENGFSVSARGRIPAEVVEAYRIAQEELAKPKARRTATKGRRQRS